jgi:hypothetical protein
MVTNLKFKRLHVSVLYVLYWDPNSFRIGNSNAFLVRIIVVRIFS